jgi:hypothetical protein
MPTTEGLQRRRFDPPRSLLSLGRYAANPEGPCDKSI